MHSMEFEIIGTETAVLLLGSSNVVSGITARKRVHKLSPEFSVFYCLTQSKRHGVSSRRVCTRNNNKRVCGLSQHPWTRHDARDSVMPSVSLRTSRVQISCRSHYPLLGLLSRPFVI